MYQLEKPPILSSLRTPFVRQTPSIAKWRSAKLVMMSVGFAGTVLFSPLASPVLAKSARHAESKPQADSKAAESKAESEIDPDAMEALNKMGTYLRTLKSFQVVSDVTKEDVLDDGQIVTDSQKVNMLAARPNMLRVEIKSDDKNVFLFYDGKNFTVYGKLVNFYATVPAPPTIGELVDKVDDQYGIEIPLVDLFKWGTDDSTTKKITSAMDMGPGTVNDVTCEQYIFRQEGVDWQIWIQLGEFPLPRKLVIRTLTDEARPEHTAVLTWNLAPSFNAAAFTFDPPADAERIALKDINADATKKAQ